MFEFASVSKPESEIQPLRPILRMANNCRPLGGTAAQDRETDNEILPGTTFPEKANGTQIDPASKPTPLSSEGPQVNGRSTTIKLFSPSQLVGSPLLPSLYKVILDAFWISDHPDGAALTNGNRFSYDGQFLDELGNAPGTFCYILYYSGTAEVIGTASAKRYIGKINEAKDGTTFVRLGPVAPDVEAWELSTMAVDVKLQRQGLASYLMKLVEDEMKRRFLADCSDPSSKQLRQMITTIKEKNEPFYLRRGFAKDYEMFYEKGHMGSETGFTVIHMSRPVQV